MRSLLFFLLAIGLFGTACNKKDEMPDPAAGSLGQVSLGTAMGTSTTYFYTGYQGEYYRYVNAPPDWGYRLPAYYAYTRDSAQYLAIVLPVLPTQSREYVLDSNTIVALYKRQGTESNAVYSPTSYGEPGQKVMAEVRPDGKVRLSFTKLSRTVYHSSDSAHRTVYDLTGHITVQ